MSNSPPFLVPPGERQLFLDGVDCVQTTNLQRILHQPEKKGALIRSADPNKTIQTRSAPLWDSEMGIYKLWVIGVDNPVRQSADGLHWIEGTRSLSATGAESMVVYDGTDPDPERRYKAARLNAGFAVSPDGVQWRKLDVPAVASFDEGNFSFDPNEGRFIHTVKRTGPHGRSLAIATSADFAHWDDYGVVFHADDIDQQMGRETIAARRANPGLQQTEYDTPEHYSVQIYNMGVFRYESLYVGLPSMYHHTGKVPPTWEGFKKMRLSPEIAEATAQHGDYTGFYTIQVACSRDLRTWTRVCERRSFIETSALGSGAYDLQSLIGPSNAVLRGDELWFYYTGIKHYAFVHSGSIKGYDDYTADAGAIHLAVLRRDGFASLEAGDSEGMVVTRAFTLTGRVLWVNVDARGGELRAELLGANNEVLAVSEPLSGDIPSGRMEWSVGAFDGRRGESVHLRFTLRNAHFYSYWIEE